MPKLKKLAFYIEEKGFLYALYRLVKYILFLLNPFKGKPRPLFVQRNKLRLMFNARGFDVFFQDKKISLSPGIDITLSPFGLWHSVSQGVWHLREQKDNRMIFDIFCPKLPLRQSWNIFLEERNKLVIDFYFDVEEEFFADELKIVFIADNLYKRWIYDESGSSFPAFLEQWKLIFENKAAFIGLEGKHFLIFRVRSNKEYLYSVENSTDKLRARLLIAKFTNMLFKKGRSCLGSLEITFIENRKTYSLIAEHLRKEKNIYPIINQSKDKVLLVNLPWERNNKPGVRAGSRWPHIKDRSEGNYLPFPFFLAYATSLLKEEGLGAKIIDAVALGLGEKDFLDMIRRERFKYLVAETSVPSFYADMDFLSKIKNEISDISIILCGANPLVYNEEFLKKYNFVDIVIYGEYEFTLLELISKLSQKKDISEVRGIIYKEGEKAKKNLPRPPGNLDRLPWPERNSLPMDKYWDLPGNIPYPSVQMLASRGCPFRCNFCLWPQIMYGGQNYRARDIKDVVDEMEFLVDYYGFKSIYFDDDTFNVGKGRMLEFCRLLKARGLHRIPWACMARADLMDEEILLNMKEAGLWAVKYGIEGASEEILKRCGKNLNLEKAIRMVKFTQKLGIKVHLTFTFGLEGETKETIKQTIKLALSLRPDSVQFSIITPFPGTRLFEELEKEGRIITKDWSLYDGHYSCVFRPDSLTPEELEAAKQYAYRVWADYQRKKRGLRGDVAKFVRYWGEGGIKYALKRTADYFDYLSKGRNKFLAEI